MKTIDDTRSQMGAAMQGFAKLLENARQQCDAVQELVVIKADEIHAREQQAEMLLRRFNGLGEMVAAITAALTSLRKPKAESELLDGEEKAAMTSRLP